MVVASCEMDVAREVGHSVAIMGVILESGDPKTVLVGPANEQLRLVLSEVL